MMLMALIITISTVVMAEEKVLNITDCGMDITVPSELVETKGMLMPYPFGAIDDMHRTYFLSFLYLAYPKEEAVIALMGAGLSEEKTAEMASSKGFLTGVLVTEASFDKAKKSLDEFVMGELKPDYDAAVEAGSAEGYTFYVMPLLNDEYLSSIDGVYAEEYKELESILLEAEQNAVFYAPEDEAKKMVGNKIRFTATDLDGNTVTSEELFSANEITMLNCWGVWCVNCLDEMEELAKIHTRMQEKGCGIVGLEWERESGEETYQLAREKMKEFGTNYPNVLMPEEEFKWVTGFPTSIFVDREGTVLGIPVIGKQVDRYEAVLDELLGGEELSEEQAIAEETEETEGAAEQEEPQKTAGPAAYIVHVTDEEDSPVEDAAVQACNDTACYFKTTGEDGTAVFEELAGEENCEIHVLEVPEGYLEDEEIYYPDASGEVTIRLQKED